MACSWEHRLGTEIVGKGKCHEIWADLEEEGELKNRQHNVRSCKM
jgi:hypothetical protein